MSADGERGSSGVFDLLRAVEGRVANPLVARLLRSRLHWLVSGRLLLLSYEGVRSHRRYETPVAYDRAGDALFVVTVPGESDWWLNFRSPYQCVVWLCGRRRAATGVVCSDPTERARRLERYRDRYGPLVRALGFGEDDGAGGDDRESDLVLVRLTLE